LPRMFQVSQAERGHLPKNKVTAYPNFFHAVRDLADFEYQTMPANLNRKRIRVQKIQDLASNLLETFDEENEAFLSSGRIEISCFNRSPDTDFLHLFKSIARFVSKKISVIFVPTPKIRESLKKVMEHETRSVAPGEKADPLEVYDVAELSILSNMCGLWAWQFKNGLERYATLEHCNPEKETEPTAGIIALTDDERAETLKWNVKRHPTSKGDPPKFTFCSWTTKGGLVRKSFGPPKSNGVFVGAGAALNAIMELAKAYLEANPTDAGLPWTDLLLKLNITRNARANTET
jgi:hypothetical protein